MKYLAYFCFFILLSACTTAPKAPQTIAINDFSYLKEYLSWLIKKEMRRQQITGLSIAVVDDQDIVWSAGFGYADKGRGVRATPTTVYRVGSITKLFSAVAIMQLAEQGLMDIDQPIATYIPEFSIKSRFGSTDNITLRNILSHRSGLPSDFIQGMWTDNPEDFTQVAHYLKQDYVANPADKVVSYSNIGFTLVGHAIQNIAGQAYAQHMHVKLLEPMGLKNSQLSSNIQAVNNLAKSYEKGKQQTQWLARDIPAAGLTSTVIDLGHFIKMIHAGGLSKQQKIISPVSLSNMLTPQNSPLNVALGPNFGLGWRFYNKVLPATLVVGHSGATLYQRSLLLTAPQAKIGVVVLANSSSADGSLGRIAKRALELLSKAKNARPIPVAKANFSPLAEDKLDFAHMVGNYATFAGFARVVEKSGRLQLKYSDKTFHLSKKSSGFYHLGYRLWGFIPIDIGHYGRWGISLRPMGRRQLLMATTPTGHRFPVGIKISKVDIPAAWENRIGQYEMVGSLPMTSLKLGDLLIRDGILIARAKLGKGLFLERALQPINNREAITTGIGRNAGETVHVVNKNGEELIRYAGILFRKISQ